MFRLLPNPWVIVGALAILALVAFKSYQLGVTATEARLEAETKRIQVELNNAGDMIAEQAEALRQAQNERQGLIDALENQARSDPGAANRVPSDISLQRLRSRWGSDSE